MKTDTLMHRPVNLRKALFTWKRCVTLWCARRPRASRCCVRRRCVRRRCSRGYSNARLGAVQMTISAEEELEGIECGRLGKTRIPFWMLVDASVLGPYNILVALLAFNCRVTALVRTITIATVYSFFAHYLFRRRPAETNHATASVQSIVPGITGNLTRIEAQLCERRDVFDAIAEEVDLIAWN